MRFRVPYRLHAARAKTKAHVAYYLLDGVMTAEPGAKVVEFEAPTFEMAKIIVQESILPGDERPIQGRTNVRHFRVS